MTPVTRLGLLGGSFDPVHAGHLALARLARAAFELDRVLFVPAARPPHKPGAVLAPGADRLAMIELAIAGEPAFDASGIELEREGPSYTIDTLRALAAELPPGGELYLILGSDNLPGLPGWREVRELLTLAQPIVVARGAVDLDGIRGRLDDDLCRRLERGLLANEPVPGRATEIRERLAAGLDPGPELPAEVRDYALRRGLYRAGS